MILMKKEVQFKKNLKFLLLSIILGVGQSGFGQIIIGRQDFEVTPSTPTIIFTTADSGSVGAGTGFSTGQSGDRFLNSPSNSNLFISGARVFRGYRFHPSTSAAASRSLTFSSVNTTNFVNVQVSFRVAAMSLGTNTDGMDLGQQIMHK